ncbi:MAG: hypothetical protein NTW86_28065 [Candidatus Sumerlaeota bacterium]|nr:hypothetical protein [Candidatus Sumerlaeota bacterium]
MARMGVHDGLDVRARFEDRQVQFDLARHLAPAGQLVAVHVDRHQVAGFHEALGDQGRRGEDAILGDAARNVAAVGLDHVLDPEAPPDLADPLPRAATCKQKG